VSLSISIKHVAQAEVRPRTLLIHDDRVGLLQKKNDQTVTASIRSRNYDCANVYVRVLCLSQHHTNVKDPIRRKASPPHPHSAYQIHQKHAIQVSLYR